MPDHKFAVILPAAGRSTRFGDPKQKKVYAEIDGRAVWLRAAEHFVNRDDVGEVCVVIAADDRELFERRYRPSVAFMNIRVVEGGAERSDSIANALESLDASCDYVAIHDAARPCVTAEQIDAVFAAAIEHGAALLAAPVADTVKHADADRLTTQTLPRQGLYLAQTPQVFRRDILTRAYANRARLGSAVTDDTQLVEAIGQRCMIVESTMANLKITGNADLRLAAAVLHSQAKPTREAPAHPFADDPTRWESVPKITPKDLFQ